MIVNLLYTNLPKKMEIAVIMINLFTNLFKVLLQEVSSKEIINIWKILILITEKEMIVVELESHLKK